MDTIKSSIMNLDQYKQNALVTEIRDNFKNDLDAKMDSASELIRTMVIPAIDNTIDRTSGKVQERMKIAIAQLSETDNARLASDKSTRNLQTLILWSKVLHPLKMVGSMLRLAVPEEAVIANADPSDEASFADWIVSGGVQPTKVIVLTDLYTKSVLGKGKLLSSDFHAVQMLFNNVKVTINTKLHKVINGVNSIETVPNSLKIVYNVTKYKEPHDSEKSLGEQIDELKAQLNMTKRFGENINEIFRSLLQQMEYSFNGAIQGHPENAFVGLDVIG